MSEDTKDLLLEIRKAVADLDDSVGGMREMMGEIRGGLDVRCPQHAERLGTLEGRMGGNGSPGVERDVAVLKSRFRTMWAGVGGVCIVVLGAFVRWWIG